VLPTDTKDSTLSYGREADALRDNALTSVADGSKCDVSINGNDVCLAPKS